MTQRDEPQTGARVNVKPVGGEHGVTVELPTVQMNIDYEENKIKLDRGYARIVTHPAVRTLETLMAERYRALSALAFTSPESALFVLMDALYQTGQNGWYLEGPVPNKILRWLQQTAGDLVHLTTPEKAEVLLVDCDHALAGLNKTAKIVVGFDPDGVMAPMDYHQCYHAIITGYPDADTGAMIFYDPELAASIKALRRHTGYNLSSRRAERWLQADPKPPAFDLNQLQERLAPLEKAQPDGVFLYSTGMGAISSVILTATSPARPKYVMIGSPYIDTRVLLEKWPARRGMPATVFLDVDDTPGIEAAIDYQTALVICEIPTNPLLRIPDLEPIVALAHQRGAKVLVDNTIATPYNLNPFDFGVDFVAHSTTKALNGKNDHIGGVIFVREPASRQALEHYNTLLKLNMDPADGRVLYQNLAGFNQRMEIMNHQAQQVAEYLARHPKVKQVNYPGLPSHPDFARARRYLRGNGSLLSFVLAGDIERNTRRFYDHLGAPIIKAPSLGSEASLLCLYTILTHYFDPPEKLARMGLEKFLLRISVGTEPLNEIFQAFEAAFKFIDEE
ncbi:PLP-dependent aspartate aminotransferase family protein [candidate division KSB1 bacterium]|nr:PLP-dependent aspartate aminotransferase family protein [candidate division KSB1 bacterium]